MAQTNQAASTPASTPTQSENSGSEQTTQNPCVVMNGDATQSILAPLVIEKPAAGEHTDVTVTPGQQYFFAFAEDDASSYIQKDGNLEISFEDGSQITLINFGDATAADLPAVFAFSTALDNKDIVVAEQIIETVPAEDELEEPQAEIRETVIVAEAVVEQPAQKVAAIEPASGEDIANALASIEPAAGEGAGSQGRGFGFQSSFSPTPVNPIEDVGPIGPTALQFDLPEVNTDLLIFEDDTPPPPVDGTPGPNARDEETVDEDDLGPIVLNDRIIGDFGTDGPGGITVNGDFNSTGSILNNVLSSDGNPITVTLVNNVYTGVDTIGRTIFTLEITNPTTGEYRFVLNEALDHADPNDPNDRISLNFGVTVSDIDGDTAPGLIVINVDDSAPVFGGDPVESVDEDNLAPASVTGDIDVNFVSNFTLAPNGTNGFNGSALNGTLTSGGVPVTVTATADGYIGVAGGQTVFTLAIDNATREFTFTLDKPLDHANAANPNDAIQLTFGVLATSNDGNTDSSTIKVNVFDSAPPAISGTANVDESDADFLASVPATITGTTTLDFGKDGAGTITPLDASTFSATAPTGLAVLTSDDDEVVVTLSGDTYTGTADGRTVFTLKIEQNGEFTYTQFQNLDHPDKSNSNDVITLGFGVKVTDFDGDTNTGTITINVADDGPVFLFGAAPATARIAAAAAIPGADVHEADLENGAQSISDTIGVDFGNDAPGTVTANNTFTFTGAVSTTNLTSGGEVVTVTFDTNTNTYVGTTAGGQTAFTLSITSITDGADYTFTQSLPLDHADASNPADIIELNFGVVAIDRDGDSVNGEITVTVADDAPLAVNDSFTADENQTVTGNIFDNDDVGQDEPATFSINGTPITANGTVINGSFGVLTINLDGSFSFTANGNNPSGSDNFSYTIRDFDGDTSTASLLFNVSPDNDVPEIIKAGFEVVDETNLPPTNEITRNGQITINFGTDGAGPVTPTTFNSSGSRLNDALTSEGNPVVTTLNGNTFTGVANGKTIFTMVIEQDGSYTFQLLGTLDHADATDPNDIIVLEFNANVADGDGDITPTTVIVNVLDDVPTIGNSFGNVDETNLDVEDELVYSDTIFTNFGAETASIVPAGTTRALVNGQEITLKSLGSDVTISATANGYVGTVNVLGAPETVFTLTIDAVTGKYTYTQIARPLDHLDANNPNDIIDLVFDVNVTSKDGDTDTGTITISVADDAPIANDDINGAEEAQLITGSVVSNDDLSRDINNTVTQVEFNGTTTTIPANGSANITTSLGILTMNSNGTYTFAATNLGDPDGTAVFTYTLVDSDGDRDTAALSIRVTPDGAPVVQEAEMTVDESGLKNPPEIINEQMNINFGVDGQGEVNPNGSIGRLGGGAELTSGGQPVTVRATANGYEAVIVGTTTKIFELIVQDTGAYSFELFGTLDHTDATDPNDNIRFEFGFTVTDSDGDKVDTLININILDDAPVAIDDSRSVIENQEITGNVLANDIPSEDSPNTLVEIRFNGVPTAVPTTGATINGVFGTLTIQQNGAFTYKANNNNPNGVDEFTYVLQDSEGDRDTAEFAITVSPSSVPGTPTADTKTIDEDNLGPITVTGTITADFGTDLPGSFCIKPTGNNFSSSDATLTSKGVPVVVTAIGDTTYVGNAGGVEVFRLVVNADGTYTFTQNTVLDHPNAANPDDNIALNFQIIAKDADGDQSEATLTINVRDSGPVANDDTNTVIESATVTGNILTNDDRGEDTPTNIVSVAGTTLTSNGTVINGTFGVLTINLDGTYSYKANDNNPDGVDRFSYTIRDFDGDTSTAELAITVSPQDDAPTPTALSKTIDEDSLNLGPIEVNDVVTADFGTDLPGSFCIKPTGNNFTSSTPLLSGGQSVVITTVNDTTFIGRAGGVDIFTLVMEPSGEYLFTLNKPLDHPITSNPDDNIALNFQIIAKDADGDQTEATLTINVRDSGPIANDDTNTVADNATVTGNILTNDDRGEDTPARIVSINGTPITANGTVITGTFGVLTINLDGTYSYKANNNNPGGVDNFNYVLSDFDGDTDPAVLRITVGGDDTPNLNTPANEIVDESNLNIVETGKLTADFGSDLPGAFTGSNVFSSSGSRTANKLSHNGTDIVVTFANGTYTGKAGTLTVFTLNIEADGDYTYRQFATLDHANGSDPNDTINLNFGVRATDNDGDGTNSTLVIQVRDDAPNAIDDGKTLVENTTVTGNVINNDDVGNDTPAKITHIQFENGTVVSIPTTGRVINGDLGTLTIQQNGAFSYKANNVNSTGVDVFKYTLTDFDGDTDIANLSFTVQNADVTPIFAAPAAEIVDESSLNITETGKFSVNFGDDGAGLFTTTGVFSSGGSRTGNTLSHEGTPIQVSFTNDTYTGKAGSLTVFTLTLNRTTGDYTYRQFATLDHKDKTNANDIIDLNFGFEVRDADGDRATQTLTVRVKDDAPNAIDDGRTLVETTTVTGNVISNDDTGNDTPAKITHIQFENGTVVTIPATGRVINGDLGTLTIQQNGTFSYKANNVNSTGVDVFKYTLTDFDGDRDIANLSFTVQDRDVTPIFAAPAAEIVDESNLNITETGKFSVNFGDDGAGLFTTTGVFSSGGSRTGNTLSHEGTPIQVSFTNDTYTGKAGSLTVFTLTLNRTTGDYTYRQFATLDHKDKTNANDIIDLNFGFEVRDADGDRATQTLTVRVKDDAPIANNDFVGNVIGSIAGGSGQGTPHDTLLKNDNRSNDEPNEITKISFGNVTKDVPSTSGKVSIKGATGTLSINKWGGWEFVQDTIETWRGTERPAGTNVFTYTLRDGDGDTDTATFTINTKRAFTPNDRENDGGDGGDGTPLVIDLDHDGIELVSIKDGTIFDIGADGILDKTGWVAADDGLLALDINKDGIINDHSELFGTRTIDGFTILSQYDSNNDGIIDANDDVFQDLLIWQDANQNGYSETTELRGLASYEIKSIDLASKASDEIIAGNDIILDGRFTYNDGSHGQIVDAVFKAEALDILYGTEAADTFIFDAINDNPVAIRDFNIEDGDALDLSALIESADTVDSAIKSFVYADQQGENTVVSINTNGESHAIAVLEGVTGVSIDDLVKQTMVA